MTLSPRSVRRDGVTRDGETNSLPRNNVAVFCVFFGLNSDSFAALENMKQKFEKSLVSKVLM
jgi:hypothetical protein